jgi:Holliday junction DNA helicase RuvB
MEDFFIDIVIDQGPNARSVRLNIQPFTLIGATTRAGMLSAPMRSRFGLVNRLDYYNAETLSTILHRSARILGVEIDEDGAREIATRSRGTPRIANNLLRRARDYAQVKADNRITASLADQALNLLDIDQDGLEEMDKRILSCIIETFSGGPVGINSLSVSVGEESDTLEEVYEPYLIQEGYLQRTAQGRIATARAYEKFGLVPPEK